MIDHTAMINQVLLLVFFAEIFSLLHIIAALSQTRRAPFTDCLLMLCGGLIVQLAVVLCIIGSPLDWVMALLGGMLICLNAVLNGWKNGKIHWLHHLTRAAVVLALVIGFVRL